MKILMVSMGSIHFFRWVEQLKDSGHEVYWFDILDGGAHSNRISWVNQKVNWKQRWNYPGRVFIKNKLPQIYRFTQFFNDRKTATEFEKYLNEVKPDVVHSFVMFMSCVPILDVMKRNKGIKWVFSAWGNDLYYLQNDEKHKKDIVKVLPHIHYMFADCERDYHIAKKYGFEGNYLGTYPTGGGYDLEFYKAFKKPKRDRNTILIKGYQHEFGRCNTVLEALVLIKEELIEYNLVVYADNQLVKNKSKELGLDSWNNFHLKGRVSHDKLLELKGLSSIYIGNSISDGMPNTLLEAIIMEAFPIQSNPGGATEEIIVNGVNGLIIEDAEDPVQISSILLNVLKNKELIDSAVEYNTKFVIPRLDFNYIRGKVLEAYNSISVNN